MKKQFFKSVVVCAVCLFPGWSASVYAAENDLLAKGFLSPPASAKPYTWWHWMNGNVSQKGITADMEAMKRVGLGGFQAFHIDRNFAGDVGYMSPEWWDMMKHTIKEADRLGLEMCFHNCAGWSSSGGPWITPGYAMQKAVWTETQVENTGPSAIKLDKPDSNNGYYRDIAVIAFPTPESECKGTGGFRINDWMEKAGFKFKPDLKQDMREIKQADIIHKDKIIVLTSSMDASGNLQWPGTEGKWTVIRFGYTPTGSKNKPAPPEGEGLECDKLSKAAAELHWENSVQKMITAAGTNVGKAFNDVLIDSYEVGNQNWTPDFQQEFEKRMGYALVPYMPVLTGRVVESLEVSERFLWDFRRVIADMMAENYYGHFAEMCHKNGLKLSIEPYGYNNGNIDEFAAASKADIPMGEFWIRSVTGGIDYTAKLASSAGHTCGRKYIGAESFTAQMSHAAFVNHPYGLKSRGDHQYCLGVNRFIFHTYVHQPWTNGLPGMTMSRFGMQFNRNNTWFEKASGWMEYLTRCQYLLQEGSFAADLCYLGSENSPNKLPFRSSMTPVPPDGYDYDFCSVENLMKMTVKNGRVCLPDGMSYRVLVLPSGNMRPAVLKKIDELVEAGAIVYGDKFEKSPSLRNYPDSDHEIKKLADKLWDSGKIISGRPLEQVLLSKDILPDFELSRVVNNDPNLYAGKSAEYIHRKIKDADVYFVSNQRQTPVQISAVFRVNGMQPELWCPETGEIKETPLYSFAKDGRTVVPLSLGPAGSVFVVFRKPADEKTRIESIAGPSENVKAQIQNGQTVLTVEETGRYEILKADGSKETVNADQISNPVTLGGSWTLRFPAGWGAPEQVELPELTDWTKHENYDIRHFSGTATYSKTFNVPAGQLGKDNTVFLDLGTVNVIAQVRLNGKDMGILWKPPFRVDVSGVVKTGDNQLEIEVVNLWANRLIGDEKYPDDCKWEKEDVKTGRKLEELPNWVKQGGSRPVPERKTFATWKWYKADAPLLPSGMTGPVRLVFAEKIILK